MLFRSSPLILSLLLMAIGNVTAKEKLWKDKLDLIPHAGLYASSLTGFKASSNLGAFGGVGVRVGKDWQLYTGADIVLMRMTVLNNNGNQMPFLIESDYLFFPVLLSYAPINKKLFKFRVYGGGLYQHLMQGNIRDYLGGGNIPQISPGYWSARAGLGINIWRIELNACADAGLANYFKQGAQANQIGAQLGVGFRF